MKRLINIISLLLLFAFMGCETDPIIFRGPYFVRFTETSLTNKESYSKTVNIEVHMAGPALDKDLTLTYKLTGSARLGIDYQIVSNPGKVVIKKGDYFGTIPIVLINNANNILRSQDVIITLETADASEVQIGQDESKIGKVFTYTIIDDCILGGNYIGVRGGVSDNVSITSSDCEVYTVSNWNINVFNTSAEMDLRFVDNGDNTITIPEQEEENIDTDFATIRGTGVVDPVTRTIILTITLVDFEDQPQVTITYIPD